MKPCVGGQSFVLACSPNYQEARKGFCHLSALWMHNANPDIKNKWIEHYSYNITQNLWLNQQAKSIQMVLARDEAYRQAAQVIIHLCKFIGKYHATF